MASSRYSVGMEGIMTSGGSEGRVAGGGGDEQPAVLPVCQQQRLYPRLDESQQQRPPPPQRPPRPPQPARPAPQTTPKAMREDGSKPILTASGVETGGNRGTDRNRYFSPGSDGTVTTSQSYKASDVNRCPQPSAEPQPDTAAAAEGQTRNHCPSPEKQPRRGAKPSHSATGNHGDLHQDKDDSHERRDEVCKDVDTVGAGATSHTNTVSIGARQVDKEMGKPKEQRILIIGKTGNGKSSLANTIVGDKKFRVGRGMFTTTVEPTEQSVTIRGKTVKVVDTPDFSNLLPKVTQAEAQQQVDQWKSLTQPAPDVILLAVRCDVRYTKEEHEIYKEIKNLWGDDKQFCGRLAVAFTFGDMQDENLKEEVKTVCQELRNVLDDAGERFLQINNKATGEEKKKELYRVRKWLDTTIPTASTAEDMDTSTSSPPDSLGNCTKDQCLLIIGKTGSGKSSLANTITGTGDFPVGQGLCTVTVEPKEISVGVGRRKVQVIDTPDLTNLGLGDKEKKQQVARWKEMAYPGPSAILLAVRGDVRFTQQERDVYEEVKKLWGDDNDFCRLLIVVFTFADRLEKPIDVDLTSGVPGLKGVSPELKEVLANAGNLFSEVSNTAPPKGKLEAVEKIFGLVENLDPSEILMDLAASSVYHHRLTNSEGRLVATDATTDGEDPTLLQPAHSTEVQPSCEPQFSCAIV